MPNDLQTIEILCHTFDLLSNKASLKHKLNLATDVLTV
jgi:hypothetical protein